MIEAPVGLRTKKVLKFSAPSDNRGKWHIPSWANTAECGSFAPLDDALWELVLANTPVEKIHPSNCKKCLRKFLTND